MSREAVSIKVDLAQNDFLDILSVLEDHRSKDRGLAVYSLIISASDAGQNSFKKMKEEWKTMMKDKLINIFLEVHRFTSLTISDSFFYDPAYMNIFTVVLFVLLRQTMKK